MKTRNREPAKIALLLALLLAGVVPLHALTDSWTNTGSGKWEVDANWSLGAPFGGDDIFITNAGTKTVTIDGNTSTNFPNTMIVTNLTISSASNLNILSLVNAGTDTPLIVLTFMDILNGSSVTITNSALQVDSMMTVASSGSGSNSLGGLTLSSGTLTVPTITVGKTNTTTGALNLTGGTTLISRLLQVGTNHSTATLSISGGALFVTNATHNASVVVDGGTFLNLGGVFVHDGDLLLTNGASLITPGNYVAGSAAGSSNTVTITGGTLTVSNGVFGLGNDGTTTNGSGTASATITNATLSAANVIVGSTVGGTGNLTVQSNASVNISSNLTVLSGSLSSTSSVTVFPGGNLSAPNGTIAIGPAGNGQMTVSGGTVIAKLVKLGGATPGASGILYLLSGGYLKVLSSISANLIVVGGGDLDGSGGTLIIGENHDAAMVIDSGSATNVGTMYVGYTPGFTGTFTQNGGMVVVTTNLIVGDCVSNAIGVATLNGGILYVTNATHTATLDVRNGTFVLNAGATLVVDTLIVTNSCGHFLNHGGTLIYNQLILDPNMDADGDGLSNGLEQSLGMDPLNPSFVCAPSGLVSWWPGAGNANDIIGNNNGTLVNGATFAAGEVGTAFSFDGVGGYVAIGGSPIPPPWTAELWVNRQDSPAYSSVLLADGATALKLEQFNFTRKVGFTQFSVADYAFNYIAPVGTWVHLAFVGNATTTQLYVNGALQDAIAASIALPLGQLGSDGAGDLLKGLVDELSVYNRALSATEIQAIYNAGSAGKCLPPVYITSVSKSGNNLNLTWLAEQRLVYRVQYKTDLSAATWTDVSGDVAATGPSASKTDVLPPGAPQRFYRVKMFR